jgi:nicotinate-nucleotide--dimethylbenzimidazole phosphoribosyltransferase
MAEYVFENMGTHDDVSMNTSYLVDIREG